MRPEDDEPFDFDPRRLRVRPAWFARHPVVPAAAALIAGILLHERLPVQPAAFAVAAAGFAGVGWMTRRATVGAVALLAAFACLGLALAQNAHFRFAADDVAHLTTDERRLAELELRLTETPRLLATPDVGRPRPPRVVTLADVTAARTWDGWRPASGTVLFRLDSPDPRLRAGDVVRVLGWLERPGPAVNPGQFDYANYYRGRRVLAGLSAEPANVTPIRRTTPPLLASLRAAAADTLTAGFSADRVEEAALLKAMLLGERDPAMSDARDLFRESGTSHYLAVSGLHVGVVGGMVLALCRVLGVGPRTSLVATGITVIGYAMLAAPSPPVLRATILAVSCGAGLLLGRRGGGVQLLAVAALILLCVAPLDLYRAGFQLSFVTVLGLIVFGEGVHRWLGGRSADDVRGQLDPAVVRAARWADRRMVTGVAAAVVAWVAAMPLVAVHFGQFNAWAVPASLAAAPFVFASLAGGVVKLALTFLLPQLAWLWADVAAVPVRLMTQTVAWFAALPGAESPLPLPPVWLVGAFYVALALAWTVGRNGNATLALSARMPLAASIMLIFVLPLAGVRPGSVGQDGLRVTLLAVGRGQCAVIETPGGGGGGVTLMDAGSMSLGRPLEQCVGPYLRHRGVARVDRVVLSHANFDHYNAADGVCGGYGVGEVAVGPHFVEEAAHQPAGRRLLAELTRLGLPPRAVEAGDAVPLGSRTLLRVLWPPADANVSGNDASAVVRLEHAGRRVLFAGDVQGEAMAALLEQHAADPGLLAADVLIAPHHGSAEAETAAFLAAVAPRHVLASNGRDLSAKHRRFDDLCRDAGIDLVRTSDAGAITLRVGDDGTTAVDRFLAGGRATLTYPE